MYYIVLKCVCTNVRSPFVSYFTEHTVSSHAFKTEYLALSMLFCVREKNE